MFVIIFLLALSVLVIIHELGHYVAARLFGVKADEFGFGFPPRIVGVVKDRGRWKIVSPRDHTPYAHTIWSLNWLPLGGFVRIKGEQDDGMNDPDSIHAKPIWQRIVIIAAGVIMNWFLAVTLFSIIFSLGTVAALTDIPAHARIAHRSIVITHVLENSPAAKSGIETGDELLRIGGTVPVSAENARTAISASGVRSTVLTVKRDSKELTLTMTPVYLAEIKKQGIGVALEDIGTVSFPLPQAILQSVILTADLTRGIVVALGDVVRQLFVGKVAQDLSGPVGIAVIANRIAKQGITPFLQFAALLSVNLAVINFLPIPALDGGRVLFLAIEKIRRRPISRHIEIGIHNIAFILLLLIILLVTARDLTRYGGVIVGGMRGAIGL